MGFQSLEMDETFLSKLSMKVGTWMTVKHEKKRVKSLDGCNIQIMDEKTFKWMKKEKENKNENLDKFILAFNLSTMFKKWKKNWKIIWEVWIGLPMPLYPKPPLGFMNLPWA